MAHTLEGKTCIVTGATSGLGRACAEQLAAAGARVELVARNPHKAEAARAEITAATGNSAVGVVIADLESQAAIRAAAKELLDRCDRIDLLLNNAGVTHRTRQETIDGLEATFAVNHLGYFLLTNLLLERLRATEAARIVNIASDAHKFGGPIDLDDVMLERKFRWTQAYGRSKGANILFTRELARRLGKAGPTVHAIHPGFVRSNLGTDTRLGKWAVRLLSPFAMSAETAAQYALEVCIGEEAGKSSGGYFYKGRPSVPSSWALDSNTAQRLWELSEELTNTKSSV